MRWLMRSRYYLIMSRDERGWEIDGYSYPDTSSANCQTRGRQVDVDLDVNGLFVRIDEGSGFDTQSCSTTIPFNVLVAMLNRLGFTVNVPPME